MDRYYRISCQKISIVCKIFENASFHYRISFMTTQIIFLQIFYYKNIKLDIFLTQLLKFLYKEQFYAKNKKAASALYWQTKNWDISKMMHFWKFYHRKKILTFYKKYLSVFYFYGEHSIYLSYIIWVNFERIRVNLCRLRVKNDSNNDLFKRAL